MRLILTLFLVFLLLLAWLASINPGTVTIFLTRDTSYTIPTIAVILFALAAGGLLAILTVGVAGTKSLLANWRLARREKRDARVQVLYTTAVAAALGLRHKEATGLFEKILTFHHSHLPSLLHLGNIYRAERNYTEAIRIHRRARASDERSLEPPLALADDLEEALRYEEAIQTLKEALRLDDANYTVLRRLRDLLLKLDRWEELEDLQERLTRLPPIKQDQEREEALLLGVKCEVGYRRLAKEDVEGAREIFRAVVKKQRRFLPALIGMGEALLKDDRAHNAAELWEKAYTETGQWVLLQRLEDLYLDLGQPEKIITLYRGALNKQPASRALRFSLGKLYSRLEMLDEAIETLHPLDSPDGRSPEVHRLLGSLYLRSRNITSAAEHFSRADEMGFQSSSLYLCSACGHHVARWTSRCPQCQRWNTLEATPPLEEKQIQAIPEQPYV